MEGIVATEGDTVTGGIVDTVTGGMEEVMDTVVMEKATTGADHVVPVRRPGSGHSRPVKTLNL